MSAIKEEIKEVRNSKGSRAAKMRKLANALKGDETPSDKKEDATEPADTADDGINYADIRHKKMMRMMKEKK